MNDYLSKPVRLRDLIATLDRNVPLQSLDRPWVAEQGQTRTGRRPSEGATALDRELLRGDDARAIGPLLPRPADPALARDPALLSRLLESILEEAPKLLDCLRDALQDRDAAEVHRLAHRLKGAVRYFEPSDLADSIMDLENCARVGDLGAAAPLFATIDANMTTFLRGIERLVEIEKDRKA
jgi:HPt (histidine-containing phosphotransfer) domain-containing protein